MDWPQRIFVSGTDTGIGKTVVSAMLVKGLNATYWKPVQSGLREETDTEAVKRMTKLPNSRFKPESYRLNEPLSPHASAAIDGVEIDMQNFSIPEYNTANLIIEGAGGLLVPLNNDSLIIDFIKQLSVGVLLVARSELGTLNHTLLSIEALRKRKIPILGVVMNGPLNESNRKAIEHYGNISVLAELEPLESINAPTLNTQFKTLFD